MRIDQHSNGGTIKMAPGQTATLTLEEKPTTGYRWRIVRDGAPVCALGDGGYHANDTRAVGGGGEHAWTLTAKQVGAASIRMRYARKSEASVEPRTEFKLDISVEAGSASIP